MEFCNLWPELKEDEQEINEYEGKINIFVLRQVIGLMMHGRSLLKVYRDNELDVICEIECVYVLDVLSHQI